MVEVPTDRKGYYRWVNTFGSVMSDFVVRNTRLNDLKKAAYVRFLKTKKKDFTLTSSEVKALLLPLNLQINLFNVGINSFSKNLKRFRPATRDERYAFGIFDYVLSHMKGLLVLYEEEVNALEEGAVEDFYDLFKQERNLYKRIAKKLNSVNFLKIKKSVEQAIVSDRGASVAMGMGVFVLSVLATPPVWADDSFVEGLSEIAGGAGLIGSAFWRNFLVPLFDFTWELIERVGYNAPNGVAGLAIIFSSLVAVYGVVRGVRWLRD